MAIRDVHRADTYQTPARGIEPRTVRRVPRPIDPIPIGVATGSALPAGAGCARALPRRPYGATPTTNWGFWPLGASSELYSTASVDTLSIAKQ